MKFILSTYFPYHECYNFIGCKTRHFVFTPTHLVWKSLMSLTTRKTKLLSTNNAVLRPAIISRQKTKTPSHFTFELEKKLYLNPFREQSFLRNRSPIERTCFFAFRILYLGSPRSGEPGFLVCHCWGCPLMEEGLKMHLSHTRILLIEYCVSATSSKLKKKLCSFNNIRYFKYDLVIIIKFILFIALLFSFSSLLLPDCLISGCRFRLWCLRCATNA